MLTELSETGGRGSASSGAIHLPSQKANFDYHGICGADYSRTGLILDHSPPALVTARQGAIDSPSLLAYSEILISSLFPGDTQNGF